MTRRLYLSFLLFLLRTPTIASSTGSSAASDATRRNSQPSAGAHPDPFVAAAPLVLAAACRDGIVIVAAHPQLESEPLLYHRYTLHEDDINDRSGTWFEELPTDYQGPFRITAMDQCAMIGVGWRADCLAVVERARAVARAEKIRYGTPMAAALLAEQVSLYLAQCAVSERVRMLSCAALLVGRDASKEGEFGMWIIDATGVYRETSVAGLARGAQPVVERLRKEHVAHLEASAVVQKMVEILTEDDFRSILPRGTRLEIVVLDSTRLARLPLNAVMASGASD